MTCCYVSLPPTPLAIDITCSARLSALKSPALLGKSVPDATLGPLILSHPELLVAPIGMLQSKLTTFKNIMGVSGEAAVELLNPYMFA